MHPDRVGAAPIQPNVNRLNADAYSLARSVLCSRICCKLSLSFSLSTTNRLQTTGEGERISPPRRTRAAARASHCHSGLTE